MEETLNSQDLIQNFNIIYLVSGRARIQTRVFLTLWLFLFYGATKKIIYEGTYYVHSF